MALKCPLCDAVRTAHLLVQMLKTLDELSVLDHSDGIPPFLQLDKKKTKILFYVLLHCP
jgi:hypothetical protein